MRWNAHLLLVAATAVAGCSIGGTSEVEEIRPEELAALDATSTTSTTTAVPPVDTSEATDVTIDTDPPASVPVTTIEPVVMTAPEIATELIRLYFVNGAEIVPVETPVLAPVGLRRILAALGSGPPAPEFEAGVRTAIPPGLVTNLRRTVAGDRITVDLDGELFEGIDPDDQRFVVAQIVLTLTMQPGIQEVLFTVDGEPLRVYQPNDELTEPGEPVTYEDYAHLVPLEQHSSSP